MNPYALFLLVVGTVLLFGSSLAEAGWSLIGFIGITAVLCALLIEWGFMLRNGARHDHR